MQLLFFIIFLGSLLCFLAAAGGLHPKFNFMALGFALFVLVPLIQMGQRAF